MSLQGNGTSAFYSFFYNSCSEHYKLAHIRCFTMAFFDELKASLDEAVEIADGNKKPERFSTIKVETVDGKQIYTRTASSSDDFNSHKTASLKA